MNGKFMVLEGIDGSGTTTQAQLLTNYLFEKDKKNIVVLTREPTKISPYGITLRRRLVGNLLPGEQVINEPEYWANLFINDRLWHVENVVEPSLQIGLQVVSDRHKLSTLAYQSAQGMDLDYLIEQHDSLDPPDLTIFLDIPAALATHRMGGDQQRTKEYFDGLEFQEKVRQKYLLVIEKLRDTEKIVILDGSLPVEAVAKAVQKEIDVLYGYGAAISSLK